MTPGTLEVLREHLKLDSLLICHPLPGSETHAGDYCLLPLDEERNDF